MICLSYSERLYNDTDCLYTYRYGAVVVVIVWSLDLLLIQSVPITQKVLSSNPPLIPIQRTFAWITYHGLLVFLSYWASVTIHDFSYTYKVLWFSYSERLQCLSHKRFWVRIPLRRCGLDTTLCDKVYRLLARGRWCYPGTNFLDWSSHFYRNWWRKTSFMFASLPS
jgi:hypothetical protein